MIRETEYRNESGTKCVRIWDDEPPVSTIPARLRLSLCGDDEENTEIETHEPYVETRTNEEILQEKREELNKMYAERNELEENMVDVEDNPDLYVDQLEQLEEINKYILELEWYFLSDEEKAELDRMEDEIEQQIAECIEYARLQEEYEEMIEAEAEYGEFEEEEGDIYAKSKLYNKKN